MTQLIPIGDFARLVNISPVLLRRMHKKGKLVPVYISPGGHRYYSEEQVMAFTHVSAKEKQIIGYCRIATDSEKAELFSQEESLRQFMISKGYTFSIVSDIAPLLSYNRPEFLKILANVSRNTVSKIVVLKKNILGVSLFDGIQEFCRQNGCLIECIDSSEDTKDVQDEVVQSLQFYLEYLYGNRKKKIQEFLSDIQNFFSTNPPKSTQA